MPPTKRAKQSEVAVIEDCKRRLRTQLARGNYSEVTGILNELGNQQRTLGHYEDALDSHRREIEICRSHTRGDRLGLGIAYRNLAEVYIDMKEPGKGIPHATKYLDIARELGNGVEEQRALITIGRAYLCQELYREVEEEEDGEGPLSRDKAALKRRATILASAEEWFRKAYALLTDNSLRSELKNDKEFMGMKANNCQNLGVTLETQGNISQATKWFQKGVEIGMSAGLPEYVHMNNVSLCNIYLRGKEPRKGLVCAREALKSAIAQGSFPLEVEAKLLEARACLALDDIELGKRILKKLRKKLIGKRDYASYLEDCDTLLLPAVKLSRKLDHVLTTADKSRVRTMLRLHEGIADAYADLSLFPFAIENYLKAVEYATKGGIGGKKLSSLYFSIGESYKDLGDFEQALKYYRKESQLFTDAPDEKLKTQFRIITSLVKWKGGGGGGGEGAGAEEIVEAYEEAIRLAQATQSPKKVMRAFSDFGAYLKSIGDPRADSKLKEAEEAKAQFLSEGGESESQEDPLSDGGGGSDEDSDQENEEAVDLDNLSSDGDSGEEEGGGGGGGGSSKNVALAKRRISRRKNEAGETPLHIAAKKGDLTAVRKWLRQGFEVNASDTAGWTPLHEAANFGYAKVVKELLEAGARVNDPGGPLCEGITPLHDALSNGHFSVADVLLEKGASVLARDKKKHFPIDQLIMWRNGLSREELASSHDDYRRMKELLKDKMAARGHPYTAEEERRAVRQGQKRSKSPEFTLLQPKQSCCPIPVRIAADSFDPSSLLEGDEGEEEEEDGAKVYQNAMRVLGARGGGGRVEGNKPRTRRVISPGPQTALIPSELDVHENWLIGDETLEPVPATTTTTTRRRGGGGTRRRRRSISPTEEEDEEDEELGRRRIGRRPRSRSRSRSTSPSPVPSWREEDEDEVEMDVDLSPCPSPTTASTRRGGGPSSRRLTSPSPSEDDDLLRSPILPSSFTPPPHSEEEEMVIDDEDSSPWNSVLPPSPPSRPRPRLSSNSFRPPRPPGQGGRNKSDPTPSTTSSYTTFGGSGGGGGGRNTPQKPEQPLGGGGGGGKRKRDESSSSITSRGEGVNGRDPPVLRLKIRVKGRLLLVPVDAEHQARTISWLCETAALRYKQSYGEKPILSLSTPDGALLCETDPISLVLGGGEEMILEATVLSYDSPPLSARLLLATQSLGIVPRAALLTAVKGSEVSGVLDCCGLNLHGPMAKALFRSLEGGGREIGTGVKEIRLSECSLFDEDIEELGGVLWGLMSSLSLLDLSCNGVTGSGLKSLVIGLQRGKSNSASGRIMGGGGGGGGCGAGGLKELDLSLNPLGNGVARTLSQLVNLLPNLRILRTTHSSLTHNGFYGRLGGGGGGGGGREERLDSLDLELIRRLGGG